MRRKAAGVALLLSCTIAFSSNAFAANRKLYLDIDFIPNLIFNLYDVEVYLDDNKIETISNGDDYTHLIDDVKEGKHTISFVSTDDSDIKGTYDFELTGDMTFQCTIESGDDSVDISDVNTIDNIDGSQLEVADYTGEILSSAKKALEDEGFTSVEGEAVDDSIWDEDNWIITEQNIEAGSRVDKSTEIILTCIKTQEYLDEKILQKNIPDANDQAEALGFKVSYVNDITDDDMSDRIDSMPDDEKANWKVVSIHPDSLGEKKASLNLLYYGKKAVPDVVGLSLSEALQTFDDNDFSSVSYSAVSGDSIWDTDNWKVISQSIDAGTEREADQKIELSVKSYKSIESEEAAASTENSEQQLQTGETPQSETKILETQAPETQAPETQAPETQTPETQTSETQAPETQAPETQAPETQAPETQASETQAPETETPKTDPIDLTSAETIKAVQEALNNAGYDCGTADGVVGSRTRDAISRYRSENGLTAGTEIDAELIENLGIKGEPVKSSEISEEEARRALIVALSNYYAEDVFTDDGNNYDPSKFHSYEDNSDYILSVYEDGSWTEQSGHAWNVTNMVLKNYYDDPIQISNADVTYSNDHFLISNMEGTGLSEQDLSEINNEKSAAVVISVPSSLLDYDASDSSTSAGDADASVSTDSNLSSDTSDSSGYDFGSDSSSYSSSSDEYAEKSNAREIFDAYGKIFFPDYYKSHWLIDLRDEEHNSDGTWYFKVGATVKYQGAKYYIVVSGTVNLSTYEIPDYSFDIEN